MGILHLHLLVMFSTFLSVRSCPNTNGGNLCPGRSFGGKLVLLTGNGDHCNKNFVFQLPPVGERKFLNKWTAGIIRIRRIVNRTFCPANDRMVEYPGCGEVGCSSAWKPICENDMTPTSGTTPTETVTPTTSSTSTLDVTSTSPENDMNTTSETTLTTTVTPTTSSTSTLDVTSTSPASNVTSAWGVTTGSRVRGHSFVTIKYHINRQKCVTPLNYTIKLERKTYCKDEPKECLRKQCDNDCNDLKVQKNFRGLQPYANYTVTLSVICDDTGKSHWISEDIQTEESVPTAAPIIITAKEIKRGYLIFKWEEPPCHGRNGNITNYDYFIFIKKMRGGTENRIHNVTPRNFVVFNRMERGDVYRFKVMANTKKGFGVYTDLCQGVFDNGVNNNCTNPDMGVTKVGAGVQTTPTLSSN